jgi:hypothetical protein
MIARTSRPIPTETTVKSHTVHQATPIDHIQALIDNRVPIIEEPVEALQSRHFQGEVIGHRRLRVDRGHVLAGPKWAFQLQAGNVGESSDEGVQDDKSAHSGVGADAAGSSQSRHMRRAMAHLSAEESRLSGRRSRAPVRDALEPPAAEVDSRRAAESALERALRQVMRKSRS